jgi:hypothetical protein
MSKIGNHYLGVQERGLDKDSKEGRKTYRGSPRFCTDREVLACRGNLAFRISIRKLLSKEQSEIHPLLLEREYIEWEISKNKQDLIDINRRIKDEM